MKQVTIKVDVFGNTKVDAEGFVGNTCATATKPFLTALQGKTAAEELKPEYHQQAAAKLGQRW